MLLAFTPNVCMAGRATPRLVIDADNVPPIGEF
jgi:hypothetical protein